MPIIDLSPLTDDVIKNLPNYTEEQLRDWFQNVAGTNNHALFGNSHTGSLMLQQIPSEYAPFLKWLQKQNIESYLSIGIGNGGSFLIECLMLRDTLKKAQAIDLLTYGQTLEEIQSVHSFLKTHSTADIKIDFGTSEGFLISHKDHYDCVFIDGDHSYKGVSSDFSLVKDRAKFIVLHDINSFQCPGVVQLWNEISPHYDHQIYVQNHICGIGVIKL